MNNMKYGCFHQLVGHIHWKHWLPFRKPWLKYRYTPESLLTYIESVTTEGSPKESMILEFGPLVKFHLLVGIEITVLLFPKREENRKRTSLRAYAHIIYVWLSIELLARSSSLEIVLFVKYTLFGYTALIQSNLPLQ